MGLFSNRVERSEIVAGDHIYTWRTLHFYAHHGIYLGNGLVIHFTAPPGKFTASVPSYSLSSSSSAPGGTQRSSCPNHPRCGSPKPGSGVVITCLECFLLRKGSLYRYGYEVRFRLRDGTGTAAKSDPASTVFQRANYLFENGFGDYHLVRNNCEDFALYCKTGILKIGDQGVVGRSGQIVYLLFMFRPLPRIAAAAGVREDVIKVPVEDMDKFHRHLMAT